MLTTLFNAFLNHRLMMGSVSERIVWSCDFNNMGYIRRIGTRQLGSNNLSHMHLFFAVNVICWGRGVCVNRALGILIY